jgi:hypothetical protein
MSADPSAPIVAIVGSGVTGCGAGSLLVQRGHRVAWYDRRVGVAVRAARRYGGVAADGLDEVASADVVVIAAPAPHLELVASLLDEGCHVVSTTDDRHDVTALLDLHGPAREGGSTFVLGAALSPGLTGLLARLLADQLAHVDEIHVAVHGTGGPACAVQHHRALGNRSVAWHDGGWIERPGGSGRELCWFPDPIDAVDCYRAAVADPLLLHRAFPNVQRISARVSATRRDRLTARLPMLAPPRREGDLGAIRVEVRGANERGERVTHVSGAAGRTGTLAGTIAALYAEACAARRTPAGLVTAGADANLSAWVLMEAAAAGLALHEFTGVARPAAW